MTDTKNQMSLLDAIGFTAPEDNKPADETVGAKAAKKPTNKKRKTGKKAVSKAQPEPGNTTNAPGVTAPLPDGIKAAASALPDASDTTMDNPSGAALENVPGGPLPLEQFLCFGLYSANHAMHGVYKNLLKDVGLTYPQFLAMTVLWEKNNVPVGAVTARLQLDTNTLTPLLKRLEAMGLLTRTRSTKDERQVILKLTRKGRSLQKKTEHFASCIFEATGMKLDEILTLQSQIIKLRDNLRKAGQA